MSPNAQRLLGLAKLFDIRDFFETGTLNGDLFLEVQGQFERAFTIDIHGVPPQLETEFANSNRVFLFKGSSGDRLGEILQEYKITRALFWLDAHGNQTFFQDDGKNQVPNELEAIRRYAPDSLVVIDDITWEQARNRNGMDARVRRWINSSYEFWPSSDWVVKYTGRVAILHLGGYKLLEYI